MKSKLVITLLVVSVVITALTGTIGTARAESMCDPAFVAQSGNVFTVTPTGANDTANIQCAFDAAVAYGSGAEVHLSAGNFHTAQIVVKNFDGAFTGEGPDETVIINLPNLYVTPVDFYLNPPSADNPWAMLIMFVNGNIAISDLAIKIAGEEPTTGWTVWGIDPPLNILSCAIAILGTHANASVDNFLLEGEPAQSSIVGYNVINGVYFEGFMGEAPWAPLTGTYEVYNSTFRHIYSGAPVTNLVDSTVIISHNTFEDVFDASDSSDLVNTQVTFTHNKVDGALYGYWFYVGWATSEDSHLLIKNNSFGGAYGVVMEAPLGNGSDCLIMGNNLQHVTELGVYLGPDVSGCTVVGGSNKTNALDLGTGNILTGVNNMGTGVGPTIRSFMRR